ncbi:MAG: hypothetical protein WEC75_00515 [Dehalococcoidia bacterium]
MAGLLTSRLSRPQDWRAQCLRAVSAPQTPVHSDEVARKRLERALIKQKELYTWGDLGRPEYIRERDRIQRALSALGIHNDVPRTESLERAAELLQDLGELWLHPGVSMERRAELVDEVFAEVLLDEQGIRRIVPRDDYAPLMAVADVTWEGNGRGDWI